MNYESLLGPALDQGPTFECVTYAIEGLKRFHEWRQSRSWLRFDPAELYARCKEVDGYPGQNGTLPRVAMDLLRTEGMLASDGQRYPIKAAARQSDVLALKAALHREGPVVIGFRIDMAAFGALSSASIAGLEAHDAHFSGHCVLAVGYDDGLKSFRIRNSWGDGWADNGHCWLAYEYLERVDPDFDAWSTIDA